MSPQPLSLKPKPRSLHSSTIITSGTEDHLLVIGGHDDGGTLADCWVLNTTTRGWSQVKEVNFSSNNCARLQHKIVIGTIQPHSLSASK